MLPVQQLERVDVAAPCTLDQPLVAHGATRSVDRLDMPDQRERTRHDCGLDAGRERSAYRRGVRSRYSPRAAGSVNRTVVPRPDALSIQIVPPCASTIPRA